MPGLLGGFSALLVVPGIATAQLTGIGITLCIAIVGGLVAGIIIKITGTTREPYEDSVEFTHMAGPESEQQTEQLQARIESLESKLAMLAQQSESKAPVGRDMVAELELHIKSLENEIKAIQSGSMQHKPES